MNDPMQFSGATSLFSWLKRNTNLLFCVSIDDQWNFVDLDDYVIKYPPIIFAIILRTRTTCGINLQYYK